MADVNIYSVVAVFLLQCLGAFEHFRYMRAEGRVSGSFRNYLFSSHPTKSAATYLVLAASAWASVEAGVGDNVNPQLLWALLSTGHMPMATMAAVGLSLVTGYGFDSRFNKGDPVTYVDAAVEKEKQP
jgi:hypothetical protein